MFRTLARYIGPFVALTGAAAAARAEFPSGVMSGDVTDSAAVLAARTDAPESLRLEVARDADFAQLIVTDVADTTLDNGLTAKLDVAGLSPATLYYYRFVRLRDGAHSPVGRFRAAPPADEPASFRFVFSGDSDARAQPFVVLASAAGEQPDLWFWFGDTIYGDVPAGGLGVATTLDDYRAKYRQNLSDTHLQSLLAAAPVWVGWDDHEVINDYDGGDPEPDLPREQIEAGYRAFFENLPIRPQGVAGDAYRTYRSFRYGALAEFFILDGRQYRSADASRVVGGGPRVDPFAQFLPTRDEAFLAVTRDPGRTMLGAAQFEWLVNGLIQSTARYKFIINPVPFTSLLVLPDDRWDGYDAERYALLRALDRAGVTGIIVLTTDSHANTVNPDVTWYLRHALGRRFSRGFRVPELIAGPIGTGTLGGTVRRAATMVLGGGDNPPATAFSAGLVEYAAQRVAALNQLTFVEPDRYAYLVVDVSPDGVRLTHRGISTEAAAQFRGGALMEPPGAVDLNTVFFAAESGAPSPPCFLLPLLVFAVGFASCVVAARKQRS